MDITWGPDHDQDDERSLVTEPIGADYDETVWSNEHFVLRVRPNEPSFSWMVDYHADMVEAPIESVVSGHTATSLAQAQRHAIRAMLDLLDSGVRPSRDQHMTDEQVAAAIAVYDDGVRTHQAGLTVAGLDGDNTSDIEIFDEVLVEAGLAGLVGPGFLDSDTEGRLEAAVAAYRERLRQQFTDASGREAEQGERAGLGDSHGR